MKTWQGRIASPTHPLFESFTSSTVQDRRLAPYDVRASIAHARALLAAGLLSPEDGERLVGGLEQVGREIVGDGFQWRDDLEDVHTHVEVRLHELIGEAAGALHAGRSRNDQIAADLRLFVKDAAEQTLAAILDLQAALVDLADRYRDAVMPGYTHLQQAQPVLVAQPLLTYAAMLARDWERFHEALSRADRSPLGSGAVAGAGFPLDRGLLAREAGLGEPIENATDAVSDRDFLVEFVFDAALCMTHLSRFAEDLIIWSSVEFGYVRLPDAFSSGSSMMPQKKNPDVAELIRGKAALVLGDVAGALALVKGLPLAYNRDLQEDKTPLFHAADTLIPSLQILAAMVPQLAFDTERALASISSFAAATDLADHLVLGGMPFRDAHATVAGLVARCIEERRPLDALSPEELLFASPLFADAPALSAQDSVRRKATEGSTSPDAVAVQIDRRREQIAARRAILEQ